MAIFKRIDLFPFPITQMKAPSRCCAKIKSFETAKKRPAPAARSRACPTERPCSYTLFYDAQTENIHTFCPFFYMFYASMPSHRLVFPPTKDFCFAKQNLLKKLSCEKNRPCYAKLRHSLRCKKCTPLSSRRIAATTDRSTKKQF